MSIKPTIESGRCRSHPLCSTRTRGWLGGLAGRSYALIELNHALLSFTDPFTLESWAGRKVEGLPGLVEQVRLVGEEVLPQVG
jgi:hypothetical protein